MFDENKGQKVFCFVLLAINSENSGVLAGLVFLFCFLLAVKYSELVNSELGGS